MGPIYADYAAATPLDQGVRVAMEPYFSDLFYNPSALYLAAKEVRQAVDAARSTVARSIGARPGEIIFTAGGTEANNLAIAGVMSRYPDGKMLYLSIEHEAVREPAAQYRSEVIAVSPDGRLDIDDFRRKLTEDVVLVSVMYANNEIGVVQPLKDIAALIEIERRRRRKAATGSGENFPLYLHSDASQAPLYLDTHVAKLGVDLMTLNGGKIYGPKQTGALFIRAGVESSPLIRGGGQERGLRSGTENVPGIIGFAAALEMAVSNRRNESRRMQALQRSFIAQLSGLVPQATVNGSLKHRLPNNIHITIPGTDNERLVMELDERGILCAAGSACSAQSGEASQVLLAIGLDEDTARSSLRFTFGKSTDETAVTRIVSALNEITVKTYNK